MKKCVFISLLILTSLVSAEETLNSMENVDSLTIDLALNLNVSNKAINRTHLFLIYEPTNSTIIEVNKKITISAKHKAIQYHITEPQTFIIALSIKFNNPFLSDYNDLNSSASINFIKIFKEFIFSTLNTSIVGPPTNINVLNIYTGTGVSCELSFNLSDDFSASFISNQVSLAIQRVSSSNPITKHLGGISSLTASTLNSANKIQFSNILQFQYLTLLLTLLLIKI